MYSKAHLLISLAVGAAVAMVTGQGPLATAGTIGYAALLGVGIDVDHFLVARLNTGNWRALREVVREPALVFTDPGSIFLEGEEVTKLQRLLSHAVLSGLFVAAIYLLVPSLVTLSAIVLYVHVLCDLYQDVRDEADAESSGRL